MQPVQAANPVYAAQPQQAYAPPQAYAPGAPQPAAAVQQPAYAAPQMAVPMQVQQPQMAVAQPMQVPLQAAGVQPLQPAMAAAAHLPNAGGSAQALPVAGGSAGKPGDDGQARAGVACVGLCLLLVMVYVAWPSDATVSVRGSGINVTAMAFPTPPPEGEAAPRGGRAADPFVFEMTMPFDIASTNYFEHEALLGVTVQYAGRSTLSNGLGLGSVCPCLLAEGVSTTFDVLAQPVLTVNSPFTVPVSLSSAVDTSSLVSSNSQELFKELSADCTDDTTFEIQVSGWLNYTSLLMQNQAFETSSFELSCPQVMMSAISSRQAGTSAAAAPGALLLPLVLALWAAAVLSF